jgi:cysteinyl-tRNA synthetase
MSKSLGNVVLVRDLLGQAPGEAIRLALLSAHYRQPLDWSDEVLNEARRKLDRLYTSLRNVEGWEAEWSETKPAASFIEALDDDLNTPKALAALFDLARQINRRGNTKKGVALARQLCASAKIIGLLASDPAEWFMAEDPGAASAEAIERLLEQRAAARKNGDYAAADRIRGDLHDLGVAIEDSPQGTRWRRIAPAGDNDRSRFE